jgi:hypothetical protein
MTLTTVQATALANYINGNGPLKAYADANNYQPICDAMNLTDPSNTPVWNPNISPGQLAKLILSSDIVAMTVQKAIAAMIFMQQPFIDGTDPTTENNVNTLFGGTTSMTNFQNSARKATVFEKLFTTSNIVAIDAQGNSLYGHVAVGPDILQALGK